MTKTTELKVRVVTYLRNYCEDGKVQTTDELYQHNKNAFHIIKALADELRGKEVVAGGMKYGKAYRNALMVGNIVTNLKDGQTFAYISRDLTVTMTAKSTLPQPPKED